MAWKEPEWIIGTHAGCFVLSIMRWLDDAVNRHRPIVFDGRCFRKKRTRFYRFADWTIERVRRLGLMLCVRGYDYNPDAKPNIVCTGVSVHRLEIRKDSSASGNAR